jgi:hypothetical protein
MTTKTTDRPFELPVTGTTSAHINAGTTSAPDLMAAIEASLAAIKGLYVTTEPIDAPEDRTERLAALAAWSVSDEADLDWDHLDRIDAEGWGT